MFASGERDTWLNDVARTLEYEGLRHSPIVVIDVQSGSFLGATRAAIDVIGAPVPDHVDDLATSGLVAGPDLDHLRSRVRAVSDRPMISGLVGSESAESWSTQLRVHPPGGSRVVELHAAHHRRPGLGTEVLWLTVRSLAPHDRPTGIDPAPLASLRFRSVLDRQARLVAYSPQATVLWADLDAMLGTVITAMVHPDDLVEILPAANAVFAGVADRASYTVRMSIDGGRWATLQIEAERLVTGDDLLVVLDNRVIDEGRRQIPIGVLSEREFAIVTALFSGLRIDQVAARDQVSTKTVRNQLAGVYRKLGVSGQRDLLDTFHHPTRR